MGKIGFVERTSRAEYGEPEAKNRTTIPKWEIFCVATVVPSELTR